MTSHGFDRNFSWIYEVNSSGYDLNNDLNQKVLLLKLVTLIAADILHLINGNEVYRNSSEIKCNCYANNPTGYIVRRIRQAQSY